MNIINDLKDRGILKDITNIEKFQNIDSQAFIYSGFDPTAKSLHLGNYIQISVLLRLKKAGINVIALVGGATGIIGDPSFRSSERVMLDDKEILNNKSSIIKQLQKFDLKVIDNFDFYNNMSILDFLKNVGTLININYLLSKDSITSRLDNGLSFTEFTYSLIQGWDFYKLYKDYNVYGQFGGSDQWGNITTGLEIISKKEGANHKGFAFTTNLLTDQTGKKFGKSTGGGSLWLNPELTKPYQMYQFLLNQPDEEVEKLLKWLTFLELSEIDKIIKEHNLDPKKRHAQKQLAYQIIKDIHGQNEANASKSLSSILFDKDLDISKISINDIELIMSELKVLEVKKNENLIESLIELKVVKSKREAREFIEKGAIKLNLKSIDESQKNYSEFFDNYYAILHIGKKNIYLLKIIE
ncbi:tyrosine--tRNA ligase [Mycoplasmopsis cynos]|uniref:tyrosine--tRNA ligase n=1 Tax=Mycoplasmopsis cynos TaxID=171284 RepID=UPI002AFF56FB|nr:tyrosine--tRNA ligase [Mycoplasmopsis cynos]WQQ13123.1 tyrosine--tRNA ligase [Mycoplasmopsis cynos]WQQ14227.1 tyrosine--tRNA ligase [Mycoplasmopsis cynos]WQQ14556.1 tyrosine--tRNA ligase [Mycoplasmopsis cynos]WQQ19516.1 tyrosine--tRNA ligase [Mycoplasmopsis cynos]